MAINIAIPKSAVPPRGASVIFLAGPIRGGGNWQLEACQILDVSAPDQTWVAVPCRWTQADIPFHNFARSRGMSEECNFSRQTLWERHCINLALMSGGVLFWLPEQKEVRELSAGPYGRDTLGEIGRLSARRGLDPDLRMVIGADPTQANSNHFGLSVIACNISNDVGREITLHTTLRASIDELINQRFI